MRPPIPLLMIALATLAASVAVAAPARGGTDPEPTGSQRGSGDPAPKTHTATRFGFNEDWTTVNAGKLRRMARASAEAGADIARVPVSWAAVERIRGQYDWSKLDRAYKAITATGQRPLLVLFSSPCWARPEDPCGRAGPPDENHLGKWGAFVRNVVERYPRPVAIQVQNEPNLKLFWPNGPDAEEYVRILQVAYRQAKLADPAQKILIAGPSPAGDWRKYMKALKELGADETADGLALQPYPSRQALAGSDRKIVANSLFQLRFTQEVFGTELPLWITEIGASTDPEAKKRKIAFSPRRHARILRRLYNAFEPLAKAVIVHRLVEKPSEFPWQSGVAVMHSLKDPKPAYCQLGKLRLTEQPEICEPQAKRRRSKKRR